MKNATEPSARTSSLALLGRYVGFSHETLGITARADLIAAAVDYAARYELGLSQALITEVVRLAIDEPAVAA